MCRGQEDRIDSMHHDLASLHQVTLPCSPPGPIASPSSEPPGYSTSPQQEDISTASPEPTVIHNKHTYVYCMFIVCLHMFIVCLLLQTLQPHTNGPSVHMLLRCSRMSHELNTDVPRTDTIRRYPRGGGIWTASPPLACLQLAASGKHTQECYTVIYLHVMSACQHVSKLLH